MAMMRRGPLDRYPAEWVLRQANAHEVTGTIQFHTDKPATFFLDAGRIYAAEPGIGLDEDALAQVVVPAERHVRNQVIRLLASTIDSAGDGGWYYHDPLGSHPARGSWNWETATLIMETRARAHEESTLAAWADRNVRFFETPAASVTLGPDAWAVVVTLAGEATASEISKRLGWNPRRMLAALTEIERLGVLGPEPTWRPQAAGPAQTAQPEAAAPAPPVAPAEPAQTPAPARQLGLRKAATTSTAATAVVDAPSARVAPTPPPPLPTVAQAQTELRAERRRKLSGRWSTGA